MEASLAGMFHTDIGTRCGMQSCESTPGGPLKWGQPTTDSDSEAPVADELRTGKASFRIPKLYQVYCEVLPEVTDKMPLHREPAVATHKDRAQVKNLPGDTGGKKKFAAAVRPGEVVADGHEPASKAKPPQMTAPNGEGRALLNKNHIPLKKGKLHARQEGDKAVVGPRDYEAPALAAFDITIISPHIAMSEQYLLMAYAAHLEFRKQRIQNLRRKAELQERREKWPGEQTEKRKRYELVLAAEHKRPPPPRAKSPHTS
jgi:hypothetical protein